MALDVLGSLVTKLRLEVGHSSAAATGINMRDQLVYVLNRAQEELLDNYDWPGLTADRDVPLVAGARYYGYPDDMPFTNINQAWLRWNTLSTDLLYGIGPDQWALWNSDVGFMSWPVQRWMHHADDNTFELWPVPNQAPPATANTQATVVRFRGTRVPPWMVQDSDTCFINATALLLFAAAEVLAREGSKDAPLKLSKAQEYIRRLKVRQSAHKTTPFIIGGGTTDRDRRRGGRIGIDYIPIGYGSGPGTRTP